VTFSVLPSADRPPRLHSFELTVGTHAPAAARRKVAEVLGEWALNALTEDVALCVSELVTNSLVNGATAIHLGIERHTTEMIEVAVWDNAPGMPHRRTPHETAEDGRGLNIVEALAVCWWAQGFSTGGKTVRARFVSDSQR
jgi:hypothetical protein